MSSFVARVALSALLCGSLVVADLGCSSSTTVSDVQNQTFDYIIVGGGTAGLVVAARLSEDSNSTVLVLEAGDAHLDDPEILTPSKLSGIIGNTTYDWSFPIVPQEHANGTVINMSRGKVLGGCSAINALIWDRSAKEEYDMVAALGNSGWDWDGLEQYYQKAETFTPPDPTFAAAWNLTYDSSQLGQTGPINATFINYLPECERAVEPAGLELGLDLVRNPMDGVTSGIWRTPASMDPISRTRAYSANSYYQPNSDRCNLYVFTGSHATSILWNSSNQTSNATASGVSFYSNGTNYTVNAAKEVILSAGSIGSPWLLELSGVGSPDLLNGLGIEPVVDLPTVGENMQDHIYVMVSYKLKAGIESLDELTLNATFAAEQDQLYAESPASGANGYIATGMTFLNLRKFIPSYDDLISSLESKLSSDGSTDQQQNQLAFVTSNTSTVVEILLEGAHETTEATDGTSSYVTFLTLMQQPFSRGSSHASSSSAFDYPNINPNYFDFDFDLDVLSGVAQYVRSTLSKTEAWSAVLEEETYPASAVNSTDEWNSWVKSTFQSQGHTTGTCSMLPQSDGGVVDSNLRVYGTTNVRVVDLSIMPQQFSGHPQGLAYAIAEKGADIIKAANS